MEAIVLAGGLGTRLRPAVQDVPKPLAPVAGRPFLEFLFDYWIREGVGRIVLSVGYRRELIERHFGAQYRSACIVYAIEDRPLGTGGGLIRAARQLEAAGPTLVLNGDTWFPVPLGELVRAHRTRNADVTMALMRTPDTQRYHGVELGVEGRIASVAATGAGTRVANGGVYLFEALHRLARAHGDGPCSLERDILPREIADGCRVFGFESNAPFIDIGVPEDYARAAGVIHT